MSREPSPRTSQRRQEILDASLECFAERGYAATTLDDIRQRSGASIGSIYHLFAGKEEIAGALYLEGVRAYQDGFLDELARRRQAPHAVRGVVEYYLYRVAASPKLARFILNTRHAELLPSVRDELRQMNRLFFKSVKLRIEPYVSDGSVRRLPLELFTAIVMGPAHDYARLWLAGLTKIEPRDAAEPLATAAWAGVRTQA